MNCANHPDSPKEAAAKCLACGISICDNCRVAHKGEDYCLKCLSKRFPDTAKPGEMQGSPNHSPSLAALMSSIIAGSGQVYNGQPGKGVLVFLTAWLLIPWLFGVIDAYSTAKKINSGELAAPQGKAGCLVFFSVIMLAFLVLAAVFGIIAAIAVPNMLKSRQAAPEMPDFQTIIKTQTAEPAGDAYSEGIETESAAPPAEEAAPKKYKLYRVYLKNGQSFEAEIAREGDELYIFRLGGGTFEVGKGDVEEIKPIK